MDSIYALKPVPNSIKRKIYVYMLGLGTGTSKLIKEEYGKLDRRKKQNMRRKGDIWESDKVIGFLGCKACVKSYFTQNFKGTFKLYQSNVGVNKIEDELFSEQNYEIDNAKLFYLYYYSNLSLFQIMLSVRGHNLALKTLTKHKLLQLLELTDVEEVYTSEDFVNL
jgi:hypothetical protein